MSTLHRSMKSIRGTQYERRPLADVISKLEHSPALKPQKLTDEQIAPKCPTCQFTKWVTGHFECTRKTCKYSTSHPSRYFKDK